MPWFKERWISEPLTPTDGVVELSEPPEDVVYAGLVSDTPTDGSREFWNERPIPPNYVGEAGDYLCEEDYAAARVPVRDTGGRAVRVAATPRTVWSFEVGDNK